MNPENLLLQLSQIHVRSEDEDAFILEIPDFQMKRGEKLGIYGDSGSGKTTLLKVLSGGIFFDASYSVHGKCIFYPVAAVAIELHELTTVQSRQQRQIPIAFVPQEPVASFSLVHNIGQQLDEIALAMSSESALKLVGLDPVIKKRFPREISLGQMQRVAIAAALCMGAELILMDEPTASLDIIQKQNLLQILEHLHQHQGVSFVIVSHQSDFIQAFCSVAYRMSNGFLTNELEFPSKSVFLHSGKEEDRETQESNEQAILNICNISFRYPGQSSNVMDNFSFEFQKGIKYGITGVSGCGKSTLGRLICGMENPDAGTIKYYGKTTADHTVQEWTQRKRSIQFLWQDSLMAMNPAYTARRILQFAYNDAKSWKKDLTQEYMLRLMEHCAIEDSILDLYPVQLSGGQRQRVNLVKALLGKPDIIIADEPFSSIDESHKPALYQLFSHLPELQQVTLILISHDPADLIACCENVLIMDAGREMESGNLKKIIKNPVHPVTRKLLSASYVV